MNLNLSGMATSGVSIVAYKMVRADLAKVIVSYSGKMTTDDFNQHVARALGNQGSIVAGSFRAIDVDGQGPHAIGYIKTNREVRMPSESELKASYRVMSSNILMSNEDRSLWEVRQGKTTKYLARHGQDNLEDLVALATASAHPVSTITAKVTASVRPEQYDFVTFVNSFGDVDHGFVLASAEGRTKVCAMSSKEAVVVSNKAIISSHEIQLDPVIAKAVKNKVLADTKDGSTKDMEDFYRELFSYDKDYMNQMLDCVKQVSKEIA